jgi:hydrogenase expression/formation protein HypD
MEVCGTHTHSFFRFGIDKLLPADLQLVSGPGCPVCVSTQEYIDSAIELAKDKEVILLTFGDMLRVPGSNSSLEIQRASAADVRTVYSAYDSLEIARRNPLKRVVFLGVGFETTAPTIALSIIGAKKAGLKNLYFFTALKLIPAAMKILLQDKKTNLDGFLCPGHVSLVIGSKPYQLVSMRYRIPCCVAGFEPLDILEGVYLLLKQVKEGRAEVENQYRRAVRPEGNPKAQKVIREVFSVVDASWRGLGSIPASGLKIRNSYACFNAEKIFTIKPAVSCQLPAAKCRCGDILKGLILPAQCPLFAVACSLDKPLGPCMVSSEGACNAYYRYKLKV